MEHTLTEFPLRWLTSNHNLLFEISEPFLHSSGILRHFCQIAEHGLKYPSLRKLKSCCVIK